MLQHLAHIRPSTFQLDWYVNIHLIALLCIGDSQPTCVAVNTRVLFSHQEMMVMVKHKIHPNSDLKIGTFAFEKKIYF